MPSLSTLNPIGARFTYTYNSNGHLLSRMDPSGKLTLYDWPPQIERDQNAAEAKNNCLKYAEQSRPGMTSNCIRTVAFGPVMPGCELWQWAGDDVRRELAEYFQTNIFDATAIPDSDVVVFVKYAPLLDVIETVARRAAVIYAPLDHYESPEQIDADVKILRKCARIIVHGERLRKYFEPFAPVETMDHHVKFVADSSAVSNRCLREREQCLGTGGQGLESREYILWFGTRTNLPPLVEWVNSHSLALPLRVLTNPEVPGHIPAPAEFGFAAHVDVRIDEWTADRQLELTAAARAAIDIEGDDFRSRHKPPAQAIDFIASGVPFAMNPNSSPVQHLARMGFEIASPLDTERWLSREYRAETRQFGTVLRELLSRRRVGFRWKRIIDEILAERRHA